MRRTLLLVALAALLAAIGAYLLLPGSPLSSEARCAREVAAWEEELLPHLAEWEDLIGLAGNTSRISLSPIIREAQTVRREVMAIAPPDCASEARTYLYVHMETSLSALTSFMALESDEDVTYAMRMAAEAHRGFWQRMQDLQDVPPSMLVRWSQDITEFLSSMFPASGLPLKTYVNGYDPTTKERMGWIDIVDTKGTIVDHLEHGDPITVTKVKGQTCYIVTERGAKGLIFCYYTQMPTP